MFKNFIKTAWRGLLRNKLYSSIYILGLAVGLAIVLLDGLWIFDELTFNEKFENSGKIAQVMQHVTYNGERNSMFWTPTPLGPMLEKTYSDDFRYVVMAILPEGHLLSIKDKKIIKEGTFMSAKGPEMLTLKMLKGSRNGLTDPYSILISESTSKTIFGAEDPINKVIKMDNAIDVKVTGVYQNMPENSDFKAIQFIAPWNLFLTVTGLSQVPESWENNSFLTYVQVADNVDMEQASKKISGLIKSRVSPESAKQSDPKVFLQPMKRWHLYSEFKNGVAAGGKIEFVKLFAIIGLFVLFLACINFVNLSTARSQLRAREIGVRKTVGSSSRQLVGQFFVETMLVAAVSFMLAILLVMVMLPFFNHIADKHLIIPWGSILFWFVCLFVCICTGAIAGIYPALYLSSFQPVKVLKGTFKTGKMAVLQRKVLVVVQFTVSIALFIATLVVYRQIQFAKSRAIGYSREGLLTVNINPDITKNYEIIKDDLLKSGAVESISQTVNTTIDLLSIDNQFKWQGKDPSVAISFAFSNITPEYGRTIGWKILRGRDFSEDFSTDSSAFIVNEAAVKTLGYQDPIGKLIEWNQKQYQIIGVAGDILVESPYKQAMPSIFFTNKKNGFRTITMKLSKSTNLGKSISIISGIFGKYDPADPFDYKFVDDQYQRKFDEEVRIGKLSVFFTILAISISCLGLFGLATFVSQQRTKEIGVRKILGASKFTIWKLLSKDFVALVIISFFIAAPITFYYMNEWLQNYVYKTTISWWIFALAGFAAVVITLLTISVQIIKIALGNPTESLRMD